jgi:predicted MFS family arabinose efflux permease
MPTTLPLPFRLGGVSRRAVLLWFVYALFLVCGIAQSAIVQLLPHLADRYDLTASETALLLAVPGLATLAVSIPAGLAADRWGARRVTLSAGLLLCVSCIAQASPLFALLVAGRIAFGIAFGVVWTTGVAWIAELDDGGARLGGSVTWSSVGVMFGPAVGGVLGQAAGDSLPFLIIAGVAAAVVMPLALGSARLTPIVRDGAAADAASRPRPALSPRAVLALCRRPGFGAAAGGLTIAGAIAGSSQLLISTGLHHDGISTGRIGLVFSAAAVCYIIVSGSIVRLGSRAHTQRLNATAAALATFALLPILASGGVAALVFALLLCSVPRAIVSTIAYSLTSLGSAAGGNDGVVIGLLNGAWAIATVLTPVLAGALEQRGGVQAGSLGVIIPTAAVALVLVATARPWSGRLVA